MALTALLAVAAGGAAAAGGDEAAAVAPAAAAAPDVGFPVGEELSYRVYWGFVSVGRVLVTTAWVEEDGRRLLQIRYRARSNKVIASIYPVDDTIEALIDPNGFRPVRFVKDLHEGRLHYYQTTEFDFARGTALWEWRKFKHGETRDAKSREIPIEPDTRDIITFIYSLRGRRFEPGVEERFRVLSDEKIYDLLVKPIAREPVKLPGIGDVQSLKIEPVASFDGLFVRKGRVFLWIAEDARRICTKLTGAIPVASIRAVLDGVRGPGDDFWTANRADERTEDGRDEP